MFPLSSIGRFFHRVADQVSRLVGEVFPSQEHPTAQQAFYETARDAAAMMAAPGFLAGPAQLLFWGRLAQRLEAMDTKHPMVRGAACMMEAVNPENGILLQPIGLRSSLGACLSE